MKVVWEVGVAQEQSIRIQGSTQHAGAAQSSLPLRVLLETDSLERLDLDELQGAVLSRSSVRFCPIPVYGFVSVQCVVLSRVSVQFCPILDDLPLILQVLPHRPSADL